MQNPTNAFPKQPPSEWDFLGVYPVAGCISANFPQDLEHGSSAIPVSLHDSALFHHDKRPLQQEPFDWQLLVPSRRREDDKPLFLQLHKYGRNT